MGTCVEVFAALLLGMLGARLLSPFWPNQHVYGGTHSVLVDQAGVDFLGRYSLLNSSAMKAVICRFEHGNNATAEEDLPSVTRLLHVAEDKHVIVIVGRFEHLVLFSQVNHEDVQFVYEIREAEELAKWSPNNISEGCNITLRITSALYQLAQYEEYALTRDVIPVGKVGEMIKLELVCPPQKFWEIDWKEEVPQINVYKNIPSHLVPQVEYNVSHDNESEEKPGESQGHQQLPTQDEHPQPAVTPTTDQAGTAEITDTGIERTKFPNIEEPALEPPAEPIIQENNEKPADQPSNDVKDVQPEQQPESPSAESEVLHEEPSVLQEAKPEHDDASPGAAQVNLQPSPEPADIPVQTFEHPAEAQETVDVKAEPTPEAFAEPTPDIPPTEEVHTEDEDAETVRYMSPENAVQSETLASSSNEQLQPQPLRELQQVQSQPINQKEPPAPIEQPTVSEISPAQVQHPSSLQEQTPQAETKEAEVVDSLSAQEQTTAQADSPPEDHSPEQIIEATAFEQPHTQPTEQLLQETNHTGQEAIFTQPAKNNQQAIPESVQNDAVESTQDEHVQQVGRLQEIAEPTKPSGEFEEVPIQ